MISQRVTLALTLFAWAACAEEETGTTPTPTPPVCTEGDVQFGAACAADAGTLEQVCSNNAWVDTCFGFSVLGEGECRQGDGEYPLKFSIGYPDLDPWSDGDNAAQTQARCEAKCLEHRDWCLAVEVILVDVWPTPECGLITDRATFEGAGWTMENDTWGGEQMIDSESYMTYCGGSGDCTATDWAGGYLEPRTGFHCSLVDEL
jgi:hypothetical protein